jgi:hypothetical protein
MGLQKLASSAIVGIKLNVGLFVFGKAHADCRMLAGSID